MFRRLTAARPRRARHRPVLRRSPDTRPAELRDATSIDREKKIFYSPQANERCDYQNNKLMWQAAGEEIPI